VTAAGQQLQETEMHQLAGVKKSVQGNIYSLDREAFSRDVASR